jgi:hypothetical protein
VSWLIQSFTYIRPNISFSEGNRSIEREGERGGFEWFCALGAFGTSHLHKLGRLTLQEAREKEKDLVEHSASAQDGAYELVPFTMLSDLLGHIQQTGVKALLMSLGRAGPRIGRI